MHLRSVIRMILPIALSLVVPAVRGATADQPHRAGRSVHRTVGEDTTHLAPQHTPEHTLQSAPQHTPQHTPQNVSAAAPAPAPRDSLTGTPTDTLTKTRRRSGFSRTIRRWIYVDRPRDAENARVIDENARFRPLAGRRIASIEILRNPIFPRDTVRLHRWGNRLHALTREGVIRRDLLFRVGDRVNSEVLARNQQLLRSRDYLSDAEIELRPDPDDSTAVEVLVRTFDRWTISADASVKSRGRTMIGVSDANLFGWGNKFDIETNFNRKNWNYGGHRIDYEIPNLFGSFFEARIGGGRQFDEYDFRAGMSKSFIRPTDYEAGISFTYEHLRRTSLYWPDSVLLTGMRRFDLWGGRSRFIPSIAASLYFTGRYSRSRFKHRPDVSADFNPAFHHSDDLLTGVGLYREQFLSATMIYGYGSREDLPKGFKVELNGGYSWGEFENTIYTGVEARIGGMTRPGYLTGSVIFGTRILPGSGRWARSGISLELRWLSNLMHFGRSAIRQFVTVGYTHGWNRYRGSDELLTYTRYNGIRALDYRPPGRVRSLVNTETVVFTPYKPWGFRLTFFGFADFGSIGYKDNLFRNPFFASFGAGIRLRNERLIFKAVELRLGVAFGRDRNIESEYFRISNQKRMQPPRFNPERPEYVEYQ